MYFDGDFLYVESNPGIEDRLYNTQAQLTIAHATINEQNETIRALRANLDVMEHRLSIEEAYVAKLLSISRNAKARLPAPRPPLHPATKSTATKSQTTRYAAPRVKDEPRTN